MCLSMTNTHGATIWAFCRTASRPSKTGIVKTQIGPDYRKIRNLHNNYLQDRQVQATVNYTGIENFLNHDGCATETMGPIFDRTREHLGVSDKAVIAVRKYLINAVQEFQAGKEPPHIVRDPARNRFPHIDTFAQTIPGKRSLARSFRSSKVVGSLKSMPPRFRYRPGSRSSRAIRLSREVA